MNIEKEITSTAKTLVGAWRSRYIGLCRVDFLTFPMLPFGYGSLKLTRLRGKWQCKIEPSDSGLW